jgi:hypothetical protein
MGRVAAEMGGVAWEIGGVALGIGGAGGLEWDAGLWGVIAAMGDRGVALREWGGAMGDRGVGIKSGHD